MKSLIKKYRAVIVFMLTFLLVYAVLTFTYKFYLQWSTGNIYYPDYLTHLVAEQSADLLRCLGYEVQMVPHSEEPTIKFIVNGKYLARIVEGCNSISVIILFISFIIAFRGGWKTTFLYGLLGSVLVYVANLFRIALLSIGLYHFPWRSEILHEVIFPAIIYGLVCLLWILWVNRFSNLSKTKND
ncbi:exosortase family protein XrtF [Mangrovimonas sp. CR14]|uniref:exosortase family protein XrtF n=1 Tax=Mangrovimonas sp. CR14 TaxID=2706120 RepID=UPI0014226237|nr:exosortase family protein XrtF [Mangrovimonas sp. CR14]NIK93044.1 exosortase family protein XrtF [Mangrovimonas sp. CR14]